MALFSRLILNNVKYNTTKIINIQIFIAIVPCNDTSMKYVPIKITVMHSLTTSAVSLTTALTAFHKKT